MTTNNEQVLHIEVRLHGKPEKNFITPFDREDIHLLSDVMDDVIDGINRVALYHACLFRPNTCCYKVAWLFWNTCL